MLEFWSLAKSNLLLFNYFDHPWFSLSQDKRTPLHCASFEGNVEVVELLLKAKANVESKDRVCTAHLVPTGRVLALNNNAKLCGEGYSERRWALVRLLTNMCMVNDVLGWCGHGRLEDKTDHRARFTDSEAEKACFKWFSPFIQAKNKVRDASPEIGTWVTCVQNLVRHGKDRMNASKSKAKGLSMQCTDQRVWPLSSWWGLFAFGISVLTLNPTWLSAWLLGTQWQNSLAFDILISMAFFPIDRSRFRPSISVLAVNPALLSAWLRA